MTAGASKPRASIVFDVNVLIDAANPRSGNHAAAVRALSDDNDMPIYFSDMMLKTTANKLLEMGADPTVVQEYIELIMKEDDYGPEKHVIGYIQVTDYGLLDKFGESDYEDSTIISLMDAAENHARLPAVLISNDGALREWCADNHRMALRPDRISQISSQMADDVRNATYQYTSRRMFRPDGQKVPHGETKEKARQIVTHIRDELKHDLQSATPRAEARYKRFPELRPTDPPEEASEELDLFQR